MRPSAHPPALREERETEAPELLGKYLDHIGRGELLTHKEEIDLSKRTQANDQRARQKLGARRDPSFGDSGESPLTLPSSAAAILLSEH